MTRSELCKLAVVWLKRPCSSSGHGRNVAIAECQTGWSGGALPPAKAPHQIKSKTDWNPPCPT